MRFGSLDIDRSAPVDPDLFLSNMCVAFQGAASVFAILFAVVEVLSGGGKSWYLCDSEG